MKKVFTSFRKELYYLFFSSLCVLFLIEKVLINYTELFYGGAFIGSIVLKICYSILASLVFYFVAIHLGEYNKRVNIEPLLYEYLKNIKIAKNSVLSEMYFMAISSNKFVELDFPEGTKGGYVENYYPSKDEVEKLVLAIKTHKTLSKEKNWLDRFDVLKGEIEPICDSILLLDNNLKSSEISLIANLKTCVFFEKINQLKYLHNGNIANENISILRYEITEFLELMEKIEKNIIDTLK